MSDEMDYLLSILGKEGYSAMDHWMPTDHADKNDAGKFLDYLESTLDDEISPHVRVYELEDVKKRTDETTDALIHHIHQLACHALIGDGEWCSCWVCSAQADSCHSRWWQWAAAGTSQGQLRQGCHINWRSAVHTILLSLELLQCVLVFCSTEVPLTSKATIEQSLTVPEWHMPGPTWMWQLSCPRICLQRLFEESTLASWVLFQQEKPIHCSSGWPVKRYAWLAWKKEEEGWPHSSPHWRTTIWWNFTDDVHAPHTNEAYTTVCLPASASNKGMASLWIKLNTGANGNVLPLHLFRHLYPNHIDKTGHPTGLNASNTRLTAYSGTWLPHFGSLHGSIIW